LQRRQMAGKGRIEGGGWRWRCSGTRPRWGRHGKADRMAAMELCSAGHGGICDRERQRWLWLGVAATNAREGGREVRRTWWYAQFVWCPTMGAQRRRTGSSATGNGRPRRRRRSWPRAAAAHREGELRRGKERQVRVLEVPAAIPCARRRDSSAGARGSDARPWWGRSARMVDTSRTRVVQCGTSSDTWRAAKRARWDAFLGHFRADLGLAPKIKVEAHE
jgi:hypothetical protein